MLEYKISWKDFKIFTPECSNDDLELIFFFIKQGQICFPGFYMGRVHKLLLKILMPKLININ